VATIASLGADGCDICATLEWIRHLITALEIAVLALISNRQESGLPGSRR
jgi:hypothetical protein